MVVGVGARTIGWVQHENIARCEESADRRLALRVAIVNVRFMHMLKCSCNFHCRCSACVNLGQSSVTVVLRPHSSNPHRASLLAWNRLQRLYSGALFVSRDAMELHRTKRNEMPSLALSLSPKTRGGKCHARRIFDALKK